MAWLGKMSDKHPLPSLAAMRVSVHQLVSFPSHIALFVTPDLFVRSLDAIQLV